MVVTAEQQPVGAFLVRAFGRGDEGRRRRLFDHPACPDGPETQIRRREAAH